MKGVVTCQWRYMIALLLYLWETYRWQYLVCVGNGKHIALKKIHHLVTVLCRVYLRLLFSFFFILKSLMLGCHCSHKEDYYN